MSYRRVYSENVKKFLITFGFSIPLIFGIFWYLSILGDITITGYSGDMVCGGTVDDPCYAYINFTANKDIFIYPSEIWNLNLFNTDKPVEALYLQRRWGKSWRTINLTKRCTGSWCGCYWCRANQTAKYAYVFRKGKNYSIRIVGYKKNAFEDVKWSFGEIDPVWQKIGEYHHINIAGKKYYQGLTKFDLPINFTIYKDVCFDKSDFGHLKRHAKNVNITKVEITYLTNQTYQETIPNCTTFCNPYNETTINGTITISNCTTECNPYQVEKWKYVWKPIPSQICLKAYKPYIINIHLEKKPVLGFSSVDIIPKIKNYEFSKLAWWNTSYTYRYRIINLETTTPYDIAVNDTYGINNHIIWALVGNNSYVYSTQSGPSGTIAIANETNEKYWENATSGTGNQVTSIWGTNAKGIYHLESDGSDSSAGNNDGNLQGSPSFTTCKFGNCIDFDGSDDYVNITDDGDFNLANYGSITISAWVYPEAFSGWNAFVSKRTTDSDLQFLLTRIDGQNNLRWVLRRSDNVEEMCDQTDGGFTTGSWYFVVATWNGTHMQMYVNNELKCTHAYDGTNLNDNTIPVYIGRHQVTTTSWYWDGKIDEVRIYMGEAKDENWINTMYKNGLNQLTQIGTEETYLLPGIIVKQWGEFPWSNNTHVNITLNVWVFNNATKDLGLINVDVDENYTDYTITSLGSGEENLHSETKLWTRPSSVDAWFNFTAVNLTGNATGTSNEISFIIPVDPATKLDTTPPLYSLNSTNSTLAGTDVEHRLKWQDNVGLSGYIFSFLNESDGRGFTYSTDDTDLAIFYRNGSFSVDLSHSILSIDSSLTDYVGTYSILDFSYDDLIGVAYHDAYNDVAFFFRNGSYCSDTEQTDFSTDISCDSSYQYSYPSDFSVEDIIGFGMSPDQHDVAIFFKNGSFATDTDQYGFTTDIEFTEMHVWTKPSDVNVNDIIGFANDDINDDVCLYTINKSSFCDISQGTGFRSDIDFTLDSAVFTIPSDFNIGFVNDTWQSFSTNPDWSNVTKTITPSIGATIQWCVYANDTSNNWNSTSCENPFSYVTTEVIYISDCAILDSEGQTYTLTTDITDSSASRCMDITANDITLDCQGHTIDGVDDTGTYGVSVGGSNTIIRNCILTDWYGGVDVNYDYATIKNCTFSSNIGYAIFLNEHSHNTIANNTFTSNNREISLVSTYSNPCYDNLIENNTFTSYIYLYAQFPDNQQVHDNTIRNNKFNTGTDYAIAIQDAGSNKFYNNLFNCSTCIKFKGSIYSNDWNTTKQAGNRIYSTGNEIGGNYWTNSTGNGYSDTCTDSDYDGFCDDPYTLETNNIDYLPYSDEYIVGVAGCRVDIGPPETSNIVFYPWSPIARGVPPENQTSVYGILNLTNNGTLSADGFQLRVNDTEYGWTMKCSNTSNYDKSIIIDTTYKTVWSQTVNAGDVVQEWCWIDLFYPTEPYIFQYECKPL